MVSHDNHGTVVQGGVLEEDVHDEPAVDIGLETVSGGDVLVHGILVLQHDEGAGLFGRHGADGFSQLLHALASHLLFLDTQEAVENLPAPARNARLNGQAVQQMADFRLEQDDDGQNAHVQEGVQQHRHHAHIEGAHHGLENEDKHQDQNDVQDCTVSPDAPDEEKDDGGHHENVQQVCPAETQKSEYARCLQ